MKDAEESFVRRLRGRTCVQMRVQQYFCGDRLEAEWNVFWFRLNDDAWVRFFFDAGVFFFFDAGVFFWKEEPPTLPESSHLRQYKLVEPVFATSLYNKQVLAANFGPLHRDGRVLGMWFEGGAALYVQNHEDRTAVVSG